MIQPDQNSSSVKSVHDGLPCRRAFLMSLAGTVLTHPLAGISQQGKTPLMDRDTKKYINSGLAYLAGQQHRRGDLKGSFGQDSYTGNVAITSLVGLAFLSGGHHPKRGKYGIIVEQAVQYLLQQAQPNGLLMKAPEGEGKSYPKWAMYNHGFGTLFLSEVHGAIYESSLAKRVRQTLQNAIKFIIQTQNEDGGWRYQPQKVKQADLSVTVAQIMALRAARNAGITVTKEVIKRSVQYLNRCQRLADKGFRYQPQTATPTFSLTAAGLVGLHCCGIYEGKEVEAARQYLQQYHPKNPPPARYPSYWLYGHYYAAQAMRHTDPDTWREWYLAIRDRLCQSKHPPRFPNPHQKDGSWKDTQFGSDFATALACLILQIPMNYLPIIQQ